MRFNTAETIKAFNQEPAKSIDEKWQDVYKNHQENKEFLIKRNLYTPIMLNADNKTISDFCLLHHLKPTPQLTYWLSFGFPENIKEVDITCLTITTLKETKNNTIKAVKNISDYTNRIFIKGKYKGEVFSEVQKKDESYINWVMSNIPNCKTTMLKANKK